MMLRCMITVAVVPAVAMRPAASLTNRRTGILPKRHLEDEVYSGGRDMVDSRSETRAVQAVLLTGKATSSTVTTLRCLLGLNTSDTTDHARLARTPAETSRTARLKTNRTTRAPPVKVLEDSTQGLTLKDRYALATEIVNVTLKVFTDTPKPSRQSSIKEVRSKKSRTPPSSDGASSIGTPQPLGHIAANVTPTRHSPGKKPAAISPTHSQAQERNATLLVATGECARLAFAYLRSVDANEHGIRVLPKLQLELGMVALVGKLISHDLHALAVKELRQIKRRIEDISTGYGHGETSAKLGICNSERETLATLLEIKADLTGLPGIYELAVLYQLAVLKCIAHSRKPGVIEVVSDKVCSQAPNTLLDNIQRSCESNEGSEKIVRQLEGLAQLLLGLCPSVSSSMDSIARNIEQSPTPLAVFQLQMSALYVRRIWWRLTGHRGSLANELAEPFVKSLTALARRYDSINDIQQVHQAAESSYAQLLSDLSLSAENAFNVHQTLYRLADSADNSERAMTWAECALKDCFDLDKSHARVLACGIQQAVLTSSHFPQVISATSQREMTLQALEETLSGKISGHTTDYDFLLVQLSRLMRLSTWNLASIEETILRRTLAPVAATFCQRYVRSYPGRQSSQVQVVMYDAVRRSKTPDEIVPWITDDAVQIFQMNGTIRQVATLAARAPLKQAWTASSAAIILGHILQALLLKLVRSLANNHKLCIVEHQGLQNDEMAVVLEWQLHYAFELAQRRKYQTALQRLIPGILTRLSSLYTWTEYPLRRARSTCALLEWRERFPLLLSPSVVEVWQNFVPFDDIHLAGDSCLASYREDLQAGIRVLSAFANERPALGEIKASITSWQGIIENASTREAIEELIDSCEILTRQLSSIAVYLEMMGHDTVRTTVLDVLTRVYERIGASDDLQCSSQIMLAEQHILLGHEEKANSSFVKARAFDTGDHLSPLVQLQLYTAYAGFLVAIDSMVEARNVLDQARTIRLALSLNSVKKEDRRKVELLHAQIWWIQSIFLVRSDLPHDALAAAKTSLKVLNSSWTSVERSESAQTSCTAANDISSIPAGTDISGLTAGLSDLRVATANTGGSPSAVSNDKCGAPFWYLVKPLCTSLMHVSDLYANHGLFPEADYYSLRAVQFVSSVNSHQLYARVQAHRSRLLARANQQGNAELCLASIDDDDEISNASMASFHVAWARATILVKESSFEEALRLYERAKSILQVMQDGANTQDLTTARAGHQQKPASDTQFTSSGATSIVLSKKVAPKLKKGDKITAAKSGPRLKDSRPRNAANSVPESVIQLEPSSYFFVRLQIIVLVEMAFVSYKLGIGIEPIMDEMKRQCNCMSTSLRQWRPMYHSLMQRLDMALKSDVSWSMLLETALCFPAVTRTDARSTEYDVASLSMQDSQPDATMAVSTSKRRKKPTSVKISVDQSVDAILKAARACLIAGRQSIVQHGTTSKTHLDCSMLMDSGMLLSATSSMSECGVLHPVEEALNIDFPRINALEYEMQALNAEIDHIGCSSPLIWPPECSRTSDVPLNGATFQEHYIDILPKPWTAVSICLNEDCTELYIVRYRSRALPIILRLPFSRHKSNGVDDEAAFDYFAGKAELVDIIQASNVSCHNSGNMDCKGAKSSWWKKRETLDRRLHELLINMENIWLGGFKGVLSQLIRDEDGFSRFKRTFDDILGRYLPSRQSAKNKNQHISLHDGVLELFIGLGHDRGGAVDLDEPLADLLYFIVDMLRFNGEQNAYDEIDFDSMTVDVVDALRSYHESYRCDSGSSDHHLVLVLDRRLQVFPWESLPCLDGASVSRVGSMLSLRERLDAMQDLSSDHTGRHVVSRTGGTYILNPSTDLKATQTMLSPSLTKLTSSQELDWSSIVEQSPSEDDFRDALSSSPILLYFGHGAGSQYIRPRSIKKLERCSEVVWLMGCSSGAVTEHGDFEPFAVPATYLLAGSGRVERNVSPDGEPHPSNQRCMAVVATLWDVTDKDIDRLSLAVGEEWGLWPASEASKLPAKTPKKTILKRMVAPETPQRDPKTPRARKTAPPPRTPAIAKTPARSSSRSKARSEDKREMSLVEAVAKGRDACYLRYLNGAAVVVYGIPVHLGK
nr:separin [Quercus suber]